MAKEKIKQEAKPEEVEEAPKKKKGGLLKLLIPLIILGAGGGGAAWYFTQSGGKGNKAEAAKHEEKPPVYERLDTFTMNLTGGENFLQVEISLKVADAKMGEAVKLRMPEIRDGVLRLLSSKRVDELNTPEGKIKLSDDVRKLVNKMLNVQVPEQGVLGVLFTSFVIQ